MLLSPRAAAIRFRFSLLTTLAAAAVVCVFTSYHFFGPPRRHFLPVGRPASGGAVNDSHPIGTLIREGEREWDRLLEGQVHDLATAASEYRKRRGRHPPPHFDQWFEFAKNHDAVIVEEFFDQIYHDLTPFWALNATELRLQATTHEHHVVVRDHQVITVTEGEHAWVPAWSSLIESIKEHLPDVIVPLNVMDEPRLVVPWESIRGYVDLEQGAREFVDPEDVIPGFTKLSEEDWTSFSDYSFDPQFRGPSDGPYWDMIMVGCPEDSISRTYSLPEFDFSSPPPEFDNYLLRSYHGYVSNWTQAKDPCIRPELQKLDGNFIEPISISTSHKLFPLFGGSKLPMNNEILLPAAMYWADDTVWSDTGERGGDWEGKSDVLVWRGTATGGRNKKENWTGFHRHRFLSMVNSTTMHRVETGRDPPRNFVLPEYDEYNLTTGLNGQLSEFLKEHVDAGFIHLVCFPSTDNANCPYTDPYFSIVKPMDWKEQYQHKYLPDVDGNSFSGRYRPFLLSTSLPIKATVYNEWHDSRLVPWAHFVPMDSTFMDIYGIMEYFIGTDRTPDHDSAARKIALDGKRWAETVLRREDMKIYVFRLLLEYARICDEERDFLGYVEDLA